MLLRAHRWEGVATRNIQQAFSDGSCQHKRTENVVAKIRLVCDTGTRMTVKCAAWVQAKETTHGFHTSLVTSVGLGYSESAELFLVCVKKNNQVRQVFESGLEDLIGTLGPGRWKATVTVTSDTFAMIQTAIDFVIKIDNTLVDVERNDVIAA